MKNRTLLVGLFFALTRLTTGAQNVEFFPGEIYFKLEDNFPITLDQYPGDSINVPVQMPFFSAFVNTFQVSSVKRSFHFTSDDKLQRTFRVRCSDVVNLDAFVAELDAQPEVEYAEKIGVNVADYVPNDLGVNTVNGQWNLHKIDAQTAWDCSKGNPSVVVGIVDNAFQTNHPDLLLLPGWDEADQDNDPSPPTAACSHGTHVGGISGATTDNTLGIASIGFGISILPVKTTYNSVGGNCSAINKGYEGITWAAAPPAPYNLKPAKIINCSWGGGFGGTTGLNAVNYAWNQGAVVVAAAGNSNSNGLFYPAAFPNVVSVASTNINDQKSGFSNWGSTVDVCAPGESIRSLVPFGSQAIFSGTSMAAPLVSGLMGLMLSANPNMTNQDLVNCLVSSTDNIDAQNPTWIGQLGSGRINANKALMCAKNLAHPCPPHYTFVSPSDDMNVTYPTWEAQQYIEASNKISGAASIIYDAGNHILLKSGFHAATSNKFLAVIEGCGGIFSETEEVAPNQQLKLCIFPNPNAGTFSVELPEAAAPGLAFRLVSIMGQVLRAQQAEPGATIQTVEASDLPAGLYFVQLISEGRVLGVSKFVKQ